MASAPTHPLKAPVAKTARPTESQNGASAAEKDAPALADNKAPVEKPSRRRWLWALAIVGGVVAIGVGVWYYFYARGFASTDDAFIDGHITPVSARVAGHVLKVYITDNQWVNQGDPIAELDPADFEAKLAAAQASLASARAGHTLRSLGVDVTEINSSSTVEEAAAAVAGAEAGVETVRAAVATSKSTLAEAEAQVVQAQAAWKQAQADLPAADARQQRAAAYLKRVAALVPERAAAKDTLDEAVSAERVAAADVAAARQKALAEEAAYKQAQAAVVAARSGVQQAEANVSVQSAALQKAQAQFAATKSVPKQVAQSRSQREVAAADISKAEADVRQAELNLSYTKIHAPVAGHVTERSIEQGAYVQVGQPLLALVERNIWITANFKETQLDQMRPGDPVTVTVDAYPGVRFAARVDSIQRGSGARFSLLPPENATGNYVKVVQRVPVKIVFNDPAQIERYALGPGMSVEPTVSLQKPGTAGDTATASAAAQ